MNKDCPNCKGSGSIVVDYKECETCNGTGYENTIELGNHFKSINSNARAKFSLDAEEDIPCDICKGKGHVEVLKQCPQCNGTGIINVCKSCGIIISEKKDYCKDCAKKIEDEKMEKEKIAKEELLAKKRKELEKKIVYELDPLCEISDLNKEYYYKGRITRVETYGVFVTLNNQVWGLMRTGDPNYNIGDEIIVRITMIKAHEGKVDMGPARIENYEVKKLKKNISRTQISSLEDSKLLKKIVRINGEVLQIQQTSGPTIFTVTDETAITWVAAFDEAGVRAYPDINIGDAIEVIGEVNQHGGKPQIESELVEKLEGGASETIHNIIEKALDERAKPENVDFLIKSHILNRLKPKMRKAAKTIRRGILDGRTILVRHHADADGICAGVAMEKAIIPIIEEINPSTDARWHYFKRSPSKAPFYELEDLVKDLSYALEDLERHGQKLPLIVLLDNGSTEEDIVSLMQAKIYDIEIVVIDHHYPGELITKEEEDGEIINGTVKVDEYVDTHVNPYLVGGDSQITAGALATEVANIINPEVKEQIKHLPGIAALGDHAKSGEALQYIDIAMEKGFSSEDLKKIAECVDFEAYFLRFMNGRGIIDTILAVDNIDKHEKIVSALYKEYETRVETQLKAAIPNVKQLTLDNGIIFNVLDVEKYSHKFTFPAPGKTCGFVHDKIAKELGEDKAIITLSHGPDFGVIRATESVNEIFGFNLNEIILNLTNKIPEAGIDGGGHECAGSIKYIEGLSKEVLTNFTNEVANMEKKLN